MPNMQPQTLVGYTLQLPTSGVTLRFQQVLGTGSFGTVYLAQSLPTFKTTSFEPKLYAVKHIPSPSTLTPLQRLYQQQELAHHHAVSAHGNIVSLYDAVMVKNDAGYFMLLEYCNQPDLFDFLAESRVDRYSDPDAVLRELFAQICDAVEHCHRKGVYHRDLKPENIMLTTERDGTLGVRLGDFGLACDAHTATRGCGSTVYMAPESHVANAFALPYDAEKADVWSLGILLCHMVSGLAPWRKATPDDAGFVYHLQHAQHGVGLGRLMGLPQGVNAVLERVFRLDARERPTAGELRDMVLELGQVRKQTVKPVEEVQLSDDDEDEMFVGECDGECPPTPEMAAQQVTLEPIKKPTWWQGRHHSLTVRA
jgi:serine/threonine protein kinase